MITNERELINRMAAGLAEGVQQCDSAFFALLCISPVGVRWNEAAQYFEYRDPSIWLSEHMQARCIGLPVLGGASAEPMDSHDFGRRCVGTIVASYAVDGALMAVARIANDSALRVIESGAYDTRITTHFDNEASSVDINHRKLIIEPPPRYLSHLSLVPRDSVEFEFGFTVIHKAFEELQQELHV
ncbi:MAG TPA: hypothetical protein VIE66_10175 [Methylocella sp.]|jgi:hypothetical protein